MPLLNLSQISKSYGAESILTGITIQLQPGEKAGLIGPNGSGKTTLLKILVGELEADIGSVHLSRGTRIGYLPQEPRAIPDGTLLSHLRYPLKHLFDLRDEIAALEKEIASRAEREGKSPEDLLEKYATLTSRFEENGGYQVESRLLSVARGLGFEEGDLDRELSSFSGGEKTRARLAGLLLQDLDLLLLDEPTNFLDLSALEWLEKFLRDLPCALLVVSHDRFFLDRVVSRIFALSRHDIKSYIGNYSAYQHQLEQERLSLDREYQHQKLLKEREERLVREAKADERSKRQARSRQKRLDKLETVERVADQKSFKLGLGYSGRSGRQVIIFDSVGIDFPDRTLFADLSFEINWGDRIALVGPNGAGKSTLLKMIAGALKPSTGSIRLGPSTRVVYFSQEQEQLEPRQNLVEAITSVSEFDVKQARNHLGRYLFRGDDVFKQVRDLSGGEKSRLALARLALSTGNCLLMDEPTSHLDLPALEEIEKVLESYPGTLIIVSHDRFFLKGMANRVFELDQGKLKIFDAPFEEYLELKENSAAAPKKDEQSKLDDKARRQEEHRRRQEEQRRIRRLKDEQARLEEEIHALEENIIELENTLSDPSRYGDHHQLAELGSSLEEARSEITSLMDRWEEVTGLLEEL
ncbi:MAG: ABC-F family ATP-binding cassette domain-containing protein [Bacillota bacterium]|nr:ABC-F family ATP-binding cassette domain-containing protein [Bacillota bacterium]